MAILKLKLKPQNQYLLKGKKCRQCEIPLLQAFKDGLIKAIYVNRRNCSSKHYCDKCHGDIFGGVRLRF